MQETITIPNKLNSIQIVLDRVKRIHKKDNVTQESIQRIMIVLDELLSNIIKYSFQDNEEHFIEVDYVFNRDAGQVEINIRDDGRGFDLNLYPICEDGLNEGGKGIKILKELSDHIHYFREGNLNNNKIWIQANCLTT